VLVHIISTCDGMGSLTPCIVQVMSRSSHPSSGVRSGSTAGRLPAAQLAAACRRRQPAGLFKVVAFRCKSAPWWHGSRARARVRPRTAGAWPPSLSRRRRQQPAGIHPCANPHGHGVCACFTVLRSPSTGGSNALLFAFAWSCSADFSDLL
jgi:hypothetical protein